MCHQTVTIMPYLCIVKQKKRWIMQLELNFETVSMKEFVNDMVSLLLWMSILSVR